MLTQILDLTFRLRYWLHVLIYAAAFAITWAIPRGAGSQRMWLALPAAISASLRTTLPNAIVVVTVLAVLLAFMGAFLRVWGTAYLGAGVVSSPKLDGHALASAGPFRYVRNPLYLGTCLHTLALTLLLSRAGALFAVAGIFSLQGLLVASEERYLPTRLGDAYASYVRAVPRFIPRLRPAPKVIGAKANWPGAVVAETYMWGTALSFAIFASTYNALLMTQGVLVAFGLSIVVRGVVENPRARATGPA